MPRPRKYKSDEERRTVRTKQQRERREQKSAAERSQRLFQDALHHQQIRSETENAHSNRLNCDAFQHNNTRESETQRSARQKNDSAQKQTCWNSPELHNSRIKTRKNYVPKRRVGHVRFFNF